MGGSNNWPIEGPDPSEWVRQTERRIGHLSRQQSPVSASDLLGPGMSSQAVNILDWNNEVATFNGFFYSSAAALNQPVIEVFDVDPETGLPVGDPDVLDPMPWTGMVIAREDGTGMQQVWNTDEPESMFFRVRNYWPNQEDPEAPVEFGDWQKFATPSGFIEGDDLAPEVQDGIGTAYDNAAEALALAEDAIGLIPPENWVFYQPTAPVSTVDHTLILGDFWFDTDSVPPNRMWTYDGSAWVDPADAIIAGGASAAQAAAYAAQQALDVAEDAITLAGSASHTYYSDTEPTGGTYSTGDTWVDTNDGNKSYRWNGSAWVTSITAWLQTNAAASAGLKVTTTGLVAYADGSAPGVPAGTPTFTITASTGAVAMLGALTSGSTVTGATVTGGIVQTSATPNVGVKMTSAGLVAYGSGSATTTIDASTGLLTTTGGVFTGGQVVGSSVTASSTGVIQTESTANRGIKMNSSGLLAYANGSGDYAAGTNTFSILATTGEVAMLGGLISGAEITASTFTTSGYLGDFTSYTTISGSSVVINSTPRVVSLTDVAYIAGVGNLYPGITATRDGATFGRMAWSGSEWTLGTVGGMTMPGSLHANNVFVDAIPVVAGGEAVFMTNTGRLVVHVAPSNIGYKRDVEDLDVNLDALAAIPVISYRYRTDVPFEVADPDEVFHGIAANVAAEAGGLDFLLGYDEDGTVHEVKERNVPWALLAGFGNHHSRIRELEEQIASLEARLNSLG